MGIIDKFFKKPPPSARELGRNEPCWCGSGEKYKKCHYDNDQKYFAKIIASSCKTPS